MDDLSESFQDARKSLNELADAASRRLSVLKNSRTDWCRDMFHKLTSRCKDTIEYVEEPSISTNERRRNNVNYKELQSYAQIDRVSGEDHDF